MIQYKFHVSRDLACLIHTTPKAWDVPGHIVGIQYCIL